jgi:hypothetical protein
MYLGRRFRHASLARIPRLHLVSGVPPVLVSSPGGSHAGPASDAAPLSPQLRCSWEVVEPAEVVLGDQHFRSGDLLLHWMPVH